MSDFKRKTVCSLIILFLSVWGVDSGWAEVVTHEFTGTITFVSGPLFGLSPAIGEPVHGSFTYDTSQPAAFDTGEVAGYIQTPPAGMTVVISGLSIQSENYNSLQVINDAFGPVDNINGFFIPVSAGGVSQPNSTMSFSLSDFTLTALPSTALPLSFDLASFEQRQGSVFDAATGGSLTFSIDPPGPTVVPVTIDIAPGTARNLVVPWLRTRITVAIISDASFNAESVDPSSVRFGPLGAAPVHSTLRNVGGGRQKDLVLQFNLRATGITCGDTSASLLGSTVEGTAIEGTDTIHTVLCIPLAPAPE